MAFKKERMTETDIEYYNSFEFKNVFFGSVKDDSRILYPTEGWLVEEGQMVRAISWIVDRDRNAFIDFVGGAWTS